MTEMPGFHVQFNKCTRTCQYLLFAEAPPPKNTPAPLETRSVITVCTLHCFLLLQTNVLFSTLYKVEGTEGLWGRVLDEFRKVRTVIITQACYTMLSHYLSKARSFCHFCARKCNKRSFTADHKLKITISIDRVRAIIDVLGPSSSITQPDKSKFANRVSYI